jgi:ActR/RegA family two-component response regulator
LVSDSLLIVEDEADWRAIYQRVARRLGIKEIQVAEDLASAETILRSRAFAVAVVDVGLNVEDDSNTDGLKVMALIRSLGDATSILVVTGRSGPDAVPITRDVLRKYQAFDAIGKVPVEPNDLQRLVAEALKAYKERETNEYPAVHDVLRGNVDPQLWDHRMIGGLQVKGAALLYSFLARLFARFLPVVARPDAASVQLDVENSLAYGTYWSRAVGQAVVVAFGHNSHFSTHSLPALEGYQLGELLHSATVGQLAGAVYALPSEARDSFPSD